MRGRLAASPLWTACPAAPAAPPAPPAPPDAQLARRPPHRRCGCSGGCRGPPRFSCASGQLEPALAAGASRCHPAPRESAGARAVGCPLRALGRRPPVCCCPRGRWRLRLPAASPRSSHSHGTVHHGSTAAVLSRPIAHMDRLFVLPDLRGTDIGAASHQPSAPGVSSPRPALAAAWRMWSG